MFTKEINIIVWYCFLDPPYIYVGLVCDPPLILLTVHKSLFKPHILYPYSLHSRL